MSLRLDWCSHDAAKYAVEHWHYSRCLPAGKVVRIGVWEAKRFIGVVLFSRGANNNIGSPYGLSQTEVCELTRVALREHDAPVSRIVSIAIKMLRRQSLGLRLIVSYADPDHGHHGGIYQAMGWIFSGLSTQTGGAEYLIQGKWIHTRSLGAKHGTRSLGVLDRIYPNSPKRVQGRKLCYLYPLDAAMREQIAPLAKPYPKRACAGGVDSDTATDHVAEGGATPTSALQTLSQEAA